MIKTVDELKALILWAKEQKLQCIKIGDIEFHVSAYGLVDAAVSPSSQTPVKPEDQQEMTTSSEDDWDPETMFHSAN